MKKQIKTTAALVALALGAGLPAAATAQQEAGTG